MNTANTQTNSAEEIGEIKVYISVNGEATDEEDESIEPWYVIIFRLSRPITPDEMLDRGFLCDLRETALDIFHESIAINDLDDFEIQGYHCDGRILSDTGHTSELCDLVISEISGPYPIAVNDVPVRVVFVDTLGDGDEDDRIRLIETLGHELIPIGAWGSNMLTMAANFGEAKVCHALIQAGSDPAAFDHAGKAAIHSACSHSVFTIGCLDVLSVLIQAGAQVNQLDLAGRHALHYAAISDYAAITATAKSCSFLIEHGAQLDHLDDQGLAPIHYAIQHQSIDVLRQLVHAGANMEQPNSKGLSPLEMKLGNDPNAMHLNEMHEATLWLITQGAPVPSTNTGKMFIEDHDSLWVSVSDLTPKMAAVIGGFLPELTELMDKDTRNNVNDSTEIERLRLYAQEIGFNQAVALIDSFKARDAINQVIAQSKSASPSAN